MISIGKRIQPGPELSSATQVRDLLLDELSDEAEMVKNDLMTGALKGAKKKK